MSTVAGPIQNVADAGRHERTERPPCFHCGELCDDSRFDSGGNVFCCQGCLVVHDLLVESGLGQFYDLSSRPGVRIRSTTRRDQWAYLDEPALQHRLLDFTDGKVSRVTFQIPAIHCVACVWLLENLFRLHPGVGRSQVNFPRREAAISFAPQKISLSELAALLASIGYEPVLTLGELEKRKPNLAWKRHWLQIGVAGFAFGNIMLFSVPAYLGMDSFSGPVFRALFGWLSLALALPVVVFSAADYWKSALLSLRQRVLTLDVPIALGLAALYGQSAFEILSGRGEGYLDSLAGLVFFLLCGRAFQQKTHERLAFDRDYKSFFPLSVTRIRSSRREEALNHDSGSDQSLLTSAATESNEQRVSLAELKVGDRILIRNHELIPADATLLSESALIDYSFVTGEAEPVAKQRGDYLYAGGKQIGSAIGLETVKPVSQSYLTSLWNHEAFQKNGDDNFNTLTNRYSRRFTFIVLGVAVVATIFWLLSGDPARAIKAFASVLIVACPCALALAAPFTLGTAQRALARIGVFLKNALALERMAQVDAIVFDKTGTLTDATSAGNSFHGVPLSAEEASWVCSLARNSTHPGSVRIGESLRGGDPVASPTSFAETPGCGIEGWVQGHEVWLGSPKWLESRGVNVGQASSLSPEASATPSREYEGRQDDACPTVGSTVGLVIDGKFRGSFALNNSLRPETDRLLHGLAANCEIALLSGDNEKERARFRSLFGSNAQLHFNQSPLDKLAFIRNLQKSGRTVMMVGDGLNDAGALKQSNVGVAVVENVGAFSPASDVILEASRVVRLNDILAFARKAARIVRWSFGISALYNVAGISIAAAGILSPIICAVLMPLSSISVVLFACGMTNWAARGINSKIKIRNPKEIRISKSEEAQDLSLAKADSASDGMDACPLTPSLSPRREGMPQSGTSEAASSDTTRISDFGCPSDFEFRISDLRKP